MPSTACSLQKFCSLLPATPNDGCVVQPDRAHFLTMRLTIPFWACMFPAEELSPLASCDATRRLLRATLAGASFALKVDHPFLGVPSAELSLPPPRDAKRRLLRATRPSARPVVPDVDHHPMHRMFSAGLSFLVSCEGKRRRFSTTRPGVLPLDEADHPLVGMSPAENSLLGPL